MSTPYATDYTPEQLERTRQTLLQVLVALGDFHDDVVLVGGLVPSLLVDQAEAAARDDAHVGSVDVDLGIRLAVVDEDRYDELAERLRDRGFEPDTNEKGNPTKQRWRYARVEESVVVDFLIDETETDGQDWGRTLHLTEDLAALRALGLRLAFDDAEARVVSGTTLDGDAAERPVRVCGPAAFVVLKAIAFRNRGSEKDAYDLVYVVRNWPGGPDAVAARWVALGDHPALAAALAVLQADFLSEQGLGPRGASRFRAGAVDDAYVADAVGDLVLFVEAVVGD
ncbi:hypothetical protein B1759_15725 [Rubrivirga sp. SAORIC476]|uniref:GSU2403 family nucleotidyltransferase fold protein n=1 Tax=Rubrivirga sp. SAORIC476 TaxID=1961794 RepID=UPI000BA93B3F|nr:GSU2403 family nucleotidyltransferase fold protein [Rubrivirga sp. SAORIC476]PAP78889.1 hypothetical protein B1759_15725 [Rubrivirga sp. SAORIC476]